MWAKACDTDRTIAQTRPSRGRRRGREAAAAVSCCGHRAPRRGSAAGTDRAGITSRRTRSLAGNSYFEKNTLHGKFLLLKGLHIYVA